MSVAAVNSNLVRASFSNANSDVEIAAPGVGVLSSWSTQVPAFNVKLDIFNAQAQPAGSFDTLNDEKVALMDGSPWAGPVPRTPLATCGATSCPPMNGVRARVCACLLVGTRLSPACALCRTWATTEGVAWARAARSSRREAEGPVQCQCPCPRLGALLGLALGPRPSSPEPA